MTPARALWLRIEPLHAVTYFHPSVPEAASAAGLKGFYMTYFGMRAAPMGPVGPGTVEATFFGFSPTRVRRAVPDVWGFASPETLLELRARTAAAALRELVPGIEDAAGRLEERLAALVRAGRPGGRPIFAANRDLEPPEDPVARLWQHCTALREHRGDGHVAALTLAGLDGCTANLLISAERQNGAAEWLRTSRSWTEEEWAAGAERLRARGLIDGDGVITGAGRVLREQVEADTDRLAAEVLDGWSEGDVAALQADLTPLARAASALLRYPNPIGLPPIPED